MPISRIPGVGLETTGTGSVNTFLRGDNAWAGTITSGTAVASTSGTSIDFTGIPSTAKRITVMFSGVSTNGTSLIQVQIGSGSVTTSGYTSQWSTNGASGSITSGFTTSYRGDTTNAIRGLMTICLISGSTYVASSVLGAASAQNDITSASGGVALSGTLDRIRITTVNGTDTFDAGTINIMWES
jgi:hypothetical protein